MSTLFTVLVLFLLSASTFCMQPAKKQIAISRNFMGVFIESLMALSETDLQNPDSLLVKLDNEVPVPLVSFDISKLYDNFFVVMFDPSNGFFEYSGYKLRSRMIPRNFYHTPEFLTFYRFFGRLLALTHRYNWILPKLLNPVLYKLLNPGAKFDLQDVRELDHMKFQSLSDCLTAQDLAETCLSFEWCDNDQVFELIPNGSDIAVNPENVVEFVHLQAAAECTFGRGWQVNSIKDGIKDVMGSKHFSIEMLSARQLFGTWKIYTNYQNCNAATPSVLLFWKFFENCSAAGKIYAYEKLTGVNSDAFISDFTAQLPRFVIVLSPLIDSIQILPNGRAIVIPIVQDEAEMYELLAKALNYGG